MKDFRNLAVWEKAHLLTLSVYTVTKNLPKEELFALTSQLRRASSSIPANIAEGCGRSTDADFSRFLQIAFGSACEVEYHLILARDLNYLTDDVHASVNHELLSVKKMLASLISKIKAER
ncbi:MAG TPA: four helix bundle protein [Pyrinomonadaceae bacterium]|nr:four helix bundle protein [Pyrinomonadaceae bacterium]